MTKKTRTIELLTVLTIAGVASTGVVQAADGTASHKSGAFKVIDHQSQTNLADEGKQAACGKGSCGTDEAGAKAAQEKHASEKKAQHRTAKAASKKTGKHQK